MIDWIKNEVEELKDWVVSGTVVDVKVWWVIAAWVIWKYVLGRHIYSALTSFLNKSSALRIHSFTLEYVST